VRASSAPRPGRSRELLPGELDAVGLAHVDTRSDNDRAASASSRSTAFSTPCFAPGRQAHFDIDSDDSYVDPASNWSRGCRATPSPWRLRDGGATVERITAPFMPR